MNYFDHYNVAKYPANIFDCFKQKSLSKSDSDSSVVTVPKNQQIRKEYDEFSTSSSEDFEMSIPKKKTSNTVCQINCKKKTDARRSNIFSDKKRNYDSAMEDTINDVNTLSNKELVSKQPDAVTYFQYVEDSLNPDTKKVSPSGSYKTNCSDVAEHKNEALNLAWKDSEGSAQILQRKKNCANNDKKKKAFRVAIKSTINDEEEVDDIIIDLRNDDNRACHKQKKKKEVHAVDGVLVDISKHKDAEKDMKKKPYFEAADKCYKESLKTNINMVSFQGKTMFTSLHADESIVNTKTYLKSASLEIEMDKETYCPDCQQLLDHCHRRVYSDYIKKKLFFKFANITRQPECDEVLTAFQAAYNEVRRVSFHQKFNFYDGAELEVPDCMYKYQWDLVHMIEEIVEGCKINKETKDGIVQLIKAKRLRKAS